MFSLLLLLNVCLHGVYMDNVSEVKLMYAHYICILFW